MYDIDHSTLLSSKVQEGIEEYNRGTFTAALRCFSHARTAASQMQRQPDELGERQMLERTYRFFWLKTLVAQRRQAVSLLLRGHGGISDIKRINRDMRIIYRRIEQSENAANPACRQRLDRARSIRRYGQRANLRDDRLRRSGVYTP